MSFVHSIEAWVEQLATQVPIELFSFVGAFLEEVIAPIPSPLILVTAGSLAFTQGKSYAFLWWICVVAAVGKTLGSWLIYFIAQKLEDLFVNKFGRFFGVAKQDIEKLKARFKGGWKDFAILTFLRATPVVPTSPVSVGCGILRINLKSYLSATFLGTVIRNIFYAYLGYAGLKAYESVLAGFDKVETILQIFAVLAVAGLIFYFYRQRKKP